MSCCSDPNCKAAKCEQKCDKDCDAKKDSDCKCCKCCKCCECN